MANLVRRGEAIEGAAVSGSSRHELVARGMQPNAVGGRCTRFVASFDVRAAVSRQLGADAQRWDPAASVDPNDEIVCDKVIIETLDRKPSRRVGARSGNHQANYWEFSKQTVVTIDRAHQEILNAIGGEARALPAAEED